MQFGSVDWGTVGLLGTMILYSGVIVSLGIGTIGWIVARRTREFRQRVALLEHEVAEFREELSSTDRTHDERE